MLYKLTYHVHLCIIVTVLPSEKKHWYYYKYINF